VALALCCSHSLSKSGFGRLQVEQVVGRVFHIRILLSSSVGIRDCITIV
jgi:hypothetical protein